MSIEKHSHQYSPHDHGIGVRVVEMSTGRRGVVKRIDETSFEWIEPLIQWDRDEKGSIEESYSRGTLILEEQ